MVGLECGERTKGADVKERMVLLGSAAISSISNSLLTVMDWRIKLPDCDNSSLFNITNNVA